MRRVCVFCGSSPGASPEYGRAAQLLGQELVRRDIALVYGGAEVGLMGLLAETVLGGGGEVVGVMPHSLVDKGVAHQGLTELRAVESMHERKAMMLDLSDAFVALPGGLGTLEELSEVLAHAQLGLHGKPCGVLDVRGFYANLLRLLDTMVEERFLKAEHRDMLLIDSSPQTLLDKLSSFEPPIVDKWLDRS